MKRFWEKEKVMIKERTFSMLLAMGENEYNMCREIYECTRYARKKYPS